MQILTASPSNGLSDDTAQIQAAIDSGDSEIFLTAGVYTVSATLTISGRQGLRVLGEGSDDSSRAGTQIRWAGNSSAAMFRLIDARLSTFQGFALYTVNPLMAFFTSETGTGTFRPNGNRFVDISMSSASGQVMDAFKWILGAGGDNNNDQFVFDHVKVSNYNNSAFNNSALTQSQQHTFVACSFVSDGYGQYGYAGINAASFYNCFWVSNTIADLNVTPALDNTVLVSGGLSIDSARFLTTSGGEFNTNNQAILIENFTFSSSASQAADGKIIIATTCGPLVLINNQVYGGGATPAQFTFSPSGGNPGNAIAIGNSVTTNLSNPFTGTGNWQLIGNSTGNAPNTPLTDAMPNALLIKGATPTAAASQIGIGTTTATSATAGANGTVPSQVAGYLVVNIGGTNFKLPYFNS